jgi:DNA polymerase-3 subunit epsilon
MSYKIHAIPESGGKLEIFFVKWVDSTMQSIGGYGKHKLEASAWAKDLFKRGFLILDTETSGVRGGFHEIVQIAVVSSNGDMLLDSLVKPEHPERLLEWGSGGKRAVDVHGLSPQILKDAPPFPTVYEQLRAIVEKQNVVIYNASFDRKMLEGDCKRHQLDGLPVKKYHCAMLKYAEFYGKRNPYTGDFRWQSLEAACQQLHIRLSEQAHNALGDCLMTLEVMRRMAAL